MSPRKFSLVSRSSNHLQGSYEIAVGGTHRGDSPPHPTLKGSYEIAVGGTHGGSEGVRGHAILTVLTVYRVDLRLVQVIPILTIVVITRCSFPPRWRLGPARP